MEMKTVQENKIFIWHSLFMAASVMTVYSPLYFWRHFWFQDGALISKMKQGLHGPVEYGNKIHLTLYVKHFNIRYA